MVRTQRGTDLWLAFLSVLLLVISPVANALSNDLPQILPAPIRDSSPVVFVVLLALMGITDYVLIAIRRILSHDPIRGRSRRLRGANIGLSVVLGVLGALAGIVSGVVVQHISALAQLSESHQPWLTILLPLVLLALLVILPLLADRLSARPDQAIENREAFLQQLSTRYRRYLDDPLQRAVRTQLELRETPAALQRHDISVEVHDRSGLTTTTTTNGTQTLEPGKTLLPILEGANGQLLIIGAQGAGKSTQLNILGRELVEQALSNPAARLPVLLDLSTWASNKDPLEKWLAEEIAESYLVRKDIAVNWVQSRQILPLLDALDGMAESDRPRCLETINAYLAEYPNEPIVVCSRREQYSRITGIQLRLQQAVTFQPLSDDAIDHALIAGGPRLDALADVMRPGTELRDAVRTPLLLSLVILTYGDLSADDIPPLQVDDSGAWRRTLFRDYVERMLTHAPGIEQKPLDFDLNTFQITLRWLGHTLREHNENTFYLERLQANWLPSKTSARHYQRLLWRVRNCLGLGIGLISALGMGLGLGIESWLLSDLQTGFAVGIGIGLVCLVGGLVVWLYFDPSEPIEPIARLALPRSRFLRTLPSALGVMLAAGVMCGRVVSMRFGPVAGVEIGLIAGLGSGFLTGIGGGGNRGRIDTGPEPVHVREEDLIRPNEGIRRSIRFSLLMILVFGVVCGLVGGLGLGITGGFRFGPDHRLIFGLIGLLIGLISGSVVGLAFSMGVGGVAALKYSALRLALSSSGVAPWHLARFLAEANFCVMLRQVGGGYQFVHELLRNDFADQYVKPNDI